MEPPIAFVTNRPLATVVKERTKRTALPCGLSCAYKHNPYRARVLAGVSVSVPIHLSLTVVVGIPVEMLPRNTEPLTRVPSCTTPTACRAIASL